MIPRIWALMFTKFHVFFQHLFKTWNTIVWTSMVNLIVNPTSDPLIHITLLSLQLCMIYALSTLIWSQKIFFLFLQITSKCQIIRYCDIKKKMLLFISIVSLMILCMFTCVLLHYWTTLDWKKKTVTFPFIFILSWMFS